MPIVTTTHDGWDCVPELKKAIKSIKEVDYYKHEILNCVRASSLRDMVSEIKIQLQEAIDTLDTINIEQQFKTIEDEH